MKKYKLWKGDRGYFVLKKIMNQNSRMMWVIDSEPFKTNELAKQALNHKEK